MTSTFIVLIALLLAPLTSAQAQTCPLPEQLPTRLEAGIRAQVESGPGSANNLRDAAKLDGDVIDQIPPGELFEVLDGPRCADGYVWWQVAWDETIGWTAEGDSERYWLEPLTRPADPAFEQGDDLAFCQEPPDNYTIVEPSYGRFNTRTVAMLDHATDVYHAQGGLLEFNFLHEIMQGSYNEGRIEASFGTHDGGGAVDISVLETVTWTPKTAEIPLMLRAMRIAGFAAWLRSADELHPGSPIHIHAIAVGDKELSEAAREQIDGPFGYLRGYNGLAQDDGIPLPDTSGEMIVCPWMIEQGFDDLRDETES